MPAAGVRGKPAIRSVTASLPCEPASARAAREFVASRLQTWNRADDGRAELVVSELVTNAVVHARTPIELTVSLGDRVVRLSVRDTSDLLPLPRRTSATRDRGRGLGIVDRLADRWGVEVLATGKVVWAEIAG